MMCKVLTSKKIEILSPRIKQMIGYTHQEQPQ
jgi:hypothetical protein